MARASSRSACGWAESSIRELAARPDSNRGDILNIVPQLLRLNLHQSCRTPAPGLAVIRGNALDIFDVSCGLSQDVMEIVANADEREILFQELGDTSGSKEEQSEDDAILLRSRAQPIGRFLQLGRSVHLWKHVLLIQSH